MIDIVIKACTCACMVGGSGSTPGNSPNSGFLGGYTVIMKSQIRVCTNGSMVTAKVNKENDLQT
jgi:hypothetical protein